MNRSNAGTIRSRALQRGARGVFRTGDTSWGAERAVRSPQLVRQQGRGPAVCAAVGVEERAGRAPKPRQLDQGAAVSSRQRAMASPSSAPTTTHLSVFHGTVVHECIYIPLLFLCSLYSTIDLLSNFWKSSIFGDIFFNFLMIFLLISGGHWCPVD